MIINVAGVWAVVMTCVAAGPEVEELNAAILQFVSAYMWEHEAFLLKRHEDVPCPWIPEKHDAATAGSILWAQFRHEGSIEDEWFTVFLLSHLTKRFKVCTSPCMCCPAGCPDEL